MSGLRPVTVITGASAGIGVELARIFAREGHELVLVAELQKTLALKGVEPQYIVNNAGFGLVGIASSLDRDEQLAMVDLNVRALTELSLSFVDSLERHRGGILNVGSMAGFLPGPGMAVYYATKSYALSFSEALHSELKPRGVRVTVLCPGPV